MLAKFKYFMQKINIVHLYLFLSIIVLSIIFLLNFFSIMSLVVGFFLFIMVYYLSKRSISKFPFILFLIAFLLRLSVISIFNTIPASDFKTIIDAAEALLHNVNLFNNNVYFYRWAYQTGPVLYTYGIFKIFGSHVFVLKIFNVLFSSFNCVLIYLISKKIFQERSARIVSLLYAFFPFAIFYNTVLSNQIPASTLFYLAFYLFLNNKNKIIPYIWVAICLSLGNFLRSEGIVYLCALVGLYLIYLLSKKANRIMHIGILIMVIGYFTLNGLLDYTVRATGINHAGLANNYPSWKFILGLNTNTCGIYDYEDIIYLEDEEMASQEVIRRLKNLTIPKAISLLSCKARITWHGEGIEWTFNNLDKSEYHLLGFTISTDLIQLIVTDLNQIIYYGVFLLMIWGLIFNLMASIKQKQKNINYSILLFVNVLAINFIVYSLIEVQSRYIYLLQISIFILSCLGLDNLSNRKCFKTR